MLAALSRDAATGQDVGLGQNEAWQRKEAKEKIEDEDENEGNMGETPVPLRYTIRLFADAE